MVLVPSFIEVDGLVVPLRIDPKDWRGPDVVRVLCEDRRRFLDGLAFVANAMLARSPAEPWMAQIDEHQDLPMPHGLMAVRVEQDRYDYTEQADAWRRLTGTSIDLSDAYNLGASFVPRSLAIPRTTFRKVMARLFELDAALQAGELEARIDPDMVVPPPVPEPEEPVLPWEDSEWETLEAQAQALDARDPLTGDGVDHGQARAVWRARELLLGDLMIAWELTQRGVDDWPGRCRALGLTTMIAYQAATTALMAYIGDAERRAFIPGELPASPYLADVSVDLFRLPATAVPAGMTRHGWLARCEAVFVAARGAPDGPTGELFTRVVGHLVRMRCRREVTQHMTLWRVELV